ncbi:REB1 [[Candida] subhashii]|uniref:REB1 n=1 Tax=[Candida] subhashii TaxID=561895 RepID=A0A8J5QHI6_9ASCO|nr:REB1 [[Candida] subhashii]KAG7662139.1 REB1 [[Candida] subhashii]
MQRGRQQEIGGAQALLQLGSKANEEETADESTLGDASKVGNDQDTNDSDVDLSDAKANQHINDAVEAAVMRYVGGTLGTSNNYTGSEGSSKKSKRKVQEDYDFNQWTGFLDDNMSHNDDFSSYKPKKKKKKGSRKNPHGIDPDLEGLGTSEHDQLVEAAIKDARELARQDELEAAMKDAGELVRHMNDSTQDQGLAAHQAQQILAAANAIEQNVSSAHDETLSAITQLAHAASSLEEAASAATASRTSAGATSSATTIATTAPATSSDAAPKKAKKSKKKKKSKDESQPEEHKQEPEPEVDPFATVVQKYHHLSDLETLIDDASTPAIEWYNAKNAEKPMGKGPRKFSDEEERALLHFMSGFCQMNKWSREDMCNRIWSNERRKDNFWESLHRVLPYRSRSSVYKHIRRQYHVFDVRARWTKEDDDLLRRLGNTHVGKWKQIGEIMGRMPEDCRDRWRNYVKCGDSRTENRWSEEEEEVLKQIVNEMIQVLESEDKKVGENTPVAINWTIVSERMKGTRSRIQCRYKWSKLVRREAALRASYMDNQTKVWLFEKIQALNVDNDGEINWEYIAMLYEQENIKDQDPEAADYSRWQPADFQAAFEKARGGIREHKSLKFDKLISMLIEDYSSRPPDVTSAASKPPRSRPESDSKTTRSVKRSGVTPALTANNKKGKGDKGAAADPSDPSSIASAAVAAVASGVEEEEAVQQEYSLWR